MDIIDATIAYEAWAAERIPLVSEHLALKHRAMGERPFPFLRATFYRWMQLWPELCGQLVEAPDVLAVGDLHIENFGTWRDIEGRLVWGINDFDEAYPLAYTNDLVRLATSAMLAARGGALALGPRTICASLLEGYRRSLEAGGRPYVLGEAHGWMRDIALSSLRDPVAYWTKLGELPDYQGRVPKKVRRLLERQLPAPDIAHRIVHRAAGLGSLGRQRFLALADWQGARVAREAKALLPSACTWADPSAPTKRLFYGEILANAVRCADPHMRPKGKWILRRLAADCSKLDLSLLPRRRDERRLLRAMGWETANIHLGTRGARRAIRRDLDRRATNWLGRAAKAMADALTADWRHWRRRAT